MTEARAVVGPGGNPMRLVLMRLAVGRAEDSAARRRLEHLLPPPGAGR
jgi:hypothetical protein